MESSILTLLIFIPVAGAVLMLPFAKLYGKENVHYYKWIAAITTGIQLALAWILYQNFNPALSITESPFTVQIDWIKLFNIQYYIGVDGLCMPLVLLTALLSFICIIASWKIEKQDTINNSLLNLAQQNTRNVTLINVIRRENCHKVEFSNKKGDTLTRKLNISKVNCLSGERCSLSGDNILLGELVGKCRDPQGEVYNFSIKHLTKLGYSFDLDFSTPRVVEKTVKVVEERFSPELLENKLHEQMETVIKEIKKTQDRLSQLKNTKDEIGRNLSSIIKANEFVGKVDKLLGGE